MTLKAQAGPEVPWDEKDPAKRADPRAWGSFQQGNADGVVFLDEVADMQFQNNTIVKNIIVPGKLRQAIPYLRAPNEKWTKRNPGKVGHAYAKEWRVLFCGQSVMDLAERASQELEQPLTCILVADHRGAIECIQPGFRRMWALEPTRTEGVWAVFFDPSRA